jgi:purine-cytosine permease-like protein
MLACGGFGCGFWWIFLAMLVVLLVVCFFGMRRMRGTGTWMGCCMSGRSGPDDKQDASKRE